MNYEPYPTSSIIEPGCTMPDRTGINLWEPLRPAIRDYRSQIRNFIVSCQSSLFQTTVNIVTYILSLGAPGSDCIT